MPNLRIPIAAVFLLLTAILIPSCAFGDRYSLPEALTDTPHPTLSAGGTETPAVSLPETPAAAFTAVPLENEDMTATAVIQMETLQPLLPTRSSTLTPEEALRASKTRSVSPDGMYGIACGSSPESILFNHQSGVVIATERGFLFQNCAENVHWAADSSFAFTVDGSGTVSRWYTADGRIESWSANVPVDPNQSCDSKSALSLDMRYLVIYKGCGIYLVDLSDHATFDHPLVIQKPFVGELLEIRWVTPHLVMIQAHFQVYDFYQAPTGRFLNNMVIAVGSGCFGQLPSISPDERWMVSESMSCNGPDDPTSYLLTDLEQGTQQIFSKSTSDLIDFIGWKPDSSGFYLISRPVKQTAQPDSRTPFGLLELNPQTGKARQIFEPVWFAAFPRDLSYPLRPFPDKNKDTLPQFEQNWADSYPRDLHRAFLAFPSRAPDGSIRLEGGLWDLKSGQITGRQVLSNRLSEALELWPKFGSAYMISASGEKIAFSARAIYPPLPAIWSHDGKRASTINADRQLVVIDLNGSAQVVAQVDTDLEESGWSFREVISWSEDDRYLIVGEKKWPVPWTDRKLELSSSSVIFIEYSDSL